MTLETTNQTLPTGVSQVEVSTEPKEITSVNLTVNTKILELLKTDALNINHLFVLIALEAGNIPILDQYDKENAELSVLLYDYQFLLVKGFLATSGPESSIMFDITDKGREFVSLIKHYSEGGDEEKETDADIRKLAEAYLELFPKIKLPSGKYARVAPPEIEKKLKTFKRTYKPYFKKHFGAPLTNEDILAATKNYVNRYAKSGYQFMVTSSYFIQKNEKSALADELIVIRQGLTKLVDKFEKQI